jgi:hypothetical protein
VFGWILLGQHHNRFTIACTVPSLVLFNLFVGFVAVALCFVVGFAFTLAFGVYGVSKYQIVSYKRSDDVGIYHRD